MHNEPIGFLIGWCLTGWLVKHDWHQPIRKLLVAATV